LDDRLFPLFSFLLWGDGGSDPKPRGCFALWPSAVHMRFVGHVPNVGETVATFMSNPSAVTSVTAASADGGLLCATDGCLYAGRTSTVLTPAQTSDTVAQVASNLNSLAAAASDAVLTRTAAVGALATYEDITLCEASVREYKGLTQAAYAEAYWTPSPPQLPGLYTAFRLALYEYPAEWLFTSMRTTLLASLSGHANDVHAVNTRGMTSGAVKSALWDSDTHDALCSPGRLGARPALFYLLCNGLQPSYATLPAGVTWPSDTAASLRVHTRQALVDDVLKGTSQSGLSTRCMYAASWACPSMPVYDAEYAPCWNAAWLAQSPEGLPRDITPCNNSRGWFAMGSPRVVPIDDVDPSHTWFSTVFLKATPPHSHTAAPSLVPLFASPPSCDNTATKTGRADALPRW